MAPYDTARGCWGSGVSDFRVELPKRVFVPGEEVRGTLHLSTNAPVECRGLHIRLEHKSEVHWHYGTGDDRKDYHGEQARFPRSAHGQGARAGHTDPQRFYPVLTPRHAACSATRWSSAPCGAPCSARRR